MPQDSIYYAIGRLSVLQKNSLDSARLERLLQAPTAQDARRALSEIGFGDGGNYEQLATAHVENACKLTRQLATDSGIIDCYLLKYDVNNLKMLLKARCLGQEAEELSPCGVYPVDTLRHAVTEHHYTALPEQLQKPLDELEKRLALNVDPLDIDVTLDKALFATIFARLPKGERTARHYFVARVDLLNLIMILRTLHMGKNEAFLRGLLLDGGTVSPQIWLKTAKTPEKLPQLLHGYGVKVYQAAIAAQMDHHKIPQLERAMDDHLLAIYTPYRREMDKPQRVIGYLLMREREAAAVRLIMAGKTAGFAPEKIRERLRDLYG
ncbi:MAG: V-type ATPase subunit [Clostridia bacterium]|nr:V-type ATPase subunit [Clostridia bacterium]